MFHKDLTGQKFGKLTVVSSAGSRGGHVYWNCRCECGNGKVARGSHLQSGNIRSCGCLPAHKTHGETHTRLYGVWANMMGRCYNPKNREYLRYGGRGVTVCEDWRDFAQFADWARASGYDETAARGECTLERRNNDLGYSPDNCVWANASVQANNTRRNRYISYQGETKTLSQWARHLGIKQSTLSRRILSGWPVEKAFTEEVKKHGS